MINITMSSQDNKDEIFYYLQVIYTIMTITNQLRNEKS